jgi:hypothetical protein
MLYVDPTPSSVSRLAQFSLTKKYRRPRRTRSEPEPAAAASTGSEEADPWAEWERWIRAHLDREREVTDAAILDAVKEIVGVTSKFADAVDDALVRTCEKIHGLEIQVAKMESANTELRAALSAERSGVVDLPRMPPLRSLREVN